MTGDPIARARKNFLFKKNTFTLKRKWLNNHINSKANPSPRIVSQLRNEWFSINDWYLVAERPKRKFGPIYTDKRINIARIEPQTNEKIVDKRINNDSNNISLRSFMKETRGFEPRRRFYIGSADFESAALPLCHVSELQNNSSKN